MKIKISDKFISFPPYVSTTWENIKSLRTEPASTTPEFLVLTLSDGYRVKIPDVDPKLSQMIFDAHLRFIEQKTETQNSLIPNIQIPLKMGLNGLGTLEGIGGALQHNQSQSNMPDLPQEILNKVKSLRQLLPKEDTEFLPKPEPHCNCMHCQLARAMNDSIEETQLVKEVEEEEVSDEDLRFKIWDIEQNGDKLYTVKNPLNHQEQYSVFLGDPIGCTCGQKNCEHLKAVLNT